MSDKNSGVITRCGLLGIFDNLSGERMVYVCAPAGYGKTVAVRQWLDRAASPRAVIACQEYHNSVPSFCRYFCEALLGCQPNNKGLEEIVSHPSFGNAPEEFTLRAVSALWDSAPVALVLDDLHYISEPRVLKLLPTLFGGLPQVFRIFLISRSSLPPELSALWIAGDLARITTEQLRFSQEEIFQLYKKRGVSITVAEAEDIVRYTDGWVMGINALLLSDNRLEGEIFGYLDTYIESHIWQRWDEGTRDFFLCTSILDQLIPALCTQLTGVADSESMLQGLMRKGAFVSQTGGGVYYYHRLFLNFITRMRVGRGEEFTRRLLDTAGHWYLAREDVHGALRYFMQSENYDGIVQCLDSLPLLGGSYVPSETLMPIVKSPVYLRAAEKKPIYFAELAWAAFLEGRAEDMASYADRYYSQREEIMKVGPHAALNFFIIRLMDFRNSLESLLPTAAAVSAYFVPAQPTGKKIGPKTINQNMPLLHRGTRDFSQCALGDVEANISGMLHAFGYLFGQEAPLLAECLMAGLLYEQGHLDSAHSHALLATAEIKEDFAAETKFFAMVPLVYTYDACRQPEAADKIMENISDLIEKSRAYHLSANLEALSVRRKLSRGCVKAARGWLSPRNVTPYDELLFYKIYEHLTSCRAYITLGDYDSAIILLTRILKLQTTYGRTLGIIETETLLSIAFWKKKRSFQREAMEHLRQAVSMAYPYRYVQMFANEGGEISGMLRRLQRSTEQRGEVSPVPVSFIKLLYLHGLEHQECGLTSGQEESSVPFTDKQKAVMKLLCQGKSYREMAEILGIKLPTLRSHISLIYKKLNVTCETDAIMKIKSMGISL